MADRQRLRIIREYAEGRRSWTNLTEGGVAKIDLSDLRLDGIDVRRAILHRSKLTRASLIGATLAVGVLYDSDFRCADLRGADLEVANASNSDFSQALLQGARLAGCDLSDARFVKANLRGADLRGAGLVHANFRKADLTGANLNRTDLKHAVFHGALLRGTILDPSARPNGHVGAFRRDPRNQHRVIGYRLGFCPVMGIERTYKPGRAYTAHIFSVADEPCHPGLYAEPSLWQLNRYAASGVFGLGSVVEISARAEDGHHVGNKYRFRELRVRRVILDNWLDMLTMGSASLRRLELRTPEP